MVFDKIKWYFTGQGTHVKNFKVFYRKYWIMLKKISLNFFNSKNLVFSIQKKYFFNSKFNFLTDGLKIQFFDGHQNWKQNFKTN